MNKICVYAICKNESKFVDRWVSALQGEADCVVVLDTGSTDDTVEKLKKYEPFVTVKQYDYMKELGYFRFDKARNDSLKLVPFDIDICVVFDLDQVPRKGWSNIIRKHFSEGNLEVEGYIIDHDKYGNELNSWRSRNVHPNSPLWTWDRVIHEGIDYRGDQQYSTTFDPDFIIDHYPDTYKDRSLYRELLTYSCKEYPKDPYYGIYLGIELSRRGTKEEAAEAFRRCLKECDFTNEDQIKYQCYLNLALVSDNASECIDVLNKAEKMEIPTRRLYEIEANIFEKLGNYDIAINKLEIALNIQSNSNDWTEDARLYSGVIEDRLSLFYYYQKQNYPKAIEYCARALSFDNKNKRLIKNMSFFYKKLVESVEEE